MAMMASSLMIAARQRFIVQAAPCTGNNLSRLRLVVAGARRAPEHVAAIRSLSSSSPPPPPPRPPSNRPPTEAEASRPTSNILRLRRPNRLHASDVGGGGSSLPSSSSALGAAAGGMSRPHTITLFPGDFQDDADSMWDDDDDDFASGATSKLGGNDDDDDTQALDETELVIQELRRREAVAAAQKEKWIQNSLPPVRVSEIDQRGRAYGRGGRKTAAARVWIQAGFGEVVVNRKPFDEYFHRLSDRDKVLEPLVATDTCGAFDVQVMVQGGGLTGQAGAVRHGLANALNHYNPDLYRPPLKKLGLLERDARKVERKKIGHVKARKSPQWVRR